MKKHLLFISLFMCLFVNFGMQAQTEIPGDSLVFGPMFSPVYNNKVRVWVLTKGETASGDALTLSMTNSEAAATELTGTVFNSDDRLGYYLRSYEFSNLTEGDTFTADLLVNGTSSGRTATIANEQNVVDDFNFLAGGCGRIYDTSRCIDIPESLTHTNGNPDMFNHMAEEDSDLMVWLGDATYLLGLQHAMGQCPDGVDDWANKDMAFDRYMFYRQYHDSLTMAMPQLSITDNHDTGPNEFNKTMPTLGEMKEIFMDWWPNPEYLSTDEGQGLHSSYVYKDVEFFLTDNRSYRDGTAQHFGDEQLEWLEQGLLNSTATFKVIINGTPTFREIGGRNFSVSTQADEFLQFIQDNNINGVISYCADIHDQRFMVREGDTKYPLYDIMSGNINSDIGGNGETGSYSVNYNAADDLMSGVKHGYVRTSVFGDEGDRRIKFEYVGYDGETFFEETVHQDMLTSQNADALNLSLDFSNAVTDASTYAHTATTENYAFGADKDGNANEALVFTANTSMSFPASSALTFENKAYSLSFWVNPSELSSNGAAIVSNGTANAGVTFGISEEGNLTYTNHATNETLESQYSVLANSWSYVSWKYNNVRRTLALYYNGFLIQTFTGVESPVASNADLTIGNNSDNQQFLGSIDALTLYARLISDADILSVADVETNRGDMLSLTGGQATVIPSETINTALEGDFTVEFWAKLDTDPGSNVSIFSSHGRNGSNNSRGMSFEFSDSNKLNIVFGTNGSGWNKIENAGEAWSIGEWNHVAVTATVGGDVNYYLNGVLAGSMSYGGYHDFTAGLGLGYSPNYGSSVTGGMDDVRIYTTALTVEEIQQTMHYPLAGDETDLALYYDFSAYDETETSVMSLGTINYEMDITSAALTTSTAPIGNISEMYQDEVVGKWSQQNEVTNNGLSLPEEISVYNSNIVIGKSIDAELAEVPEMADVFYLKGGWKIDPMNSPFADVRINLAEALGEDADSIAAIAGQYYLLKEVDGAYSNVNDGNFDGSNINFYNTNLEEAVYYLAWEEGEFTPGRGGALSLADGHDVEIHYTPVEILMGGAHTIELWVNLTETASGNDKTILSNHGRISGNSTGFTLELNGDNSLSAVYGNNGSGWTSVNTQEGLQIGEWNHVAITATPGGELKIYLNGELKASTGFTSYIANNTWEFAFGKSMNYGGSINYMADEFRMWATARTQEEIVADMHQVLDISDENLSFYFTFDQEDNGTLENEGTNVTEVTYTNATIIASASPVAEPVEGYTDGITASWSITSEENNGMFIGENIANFSENVVFGRNQDNTINTLANTEEETSYVAGGWHLNPLNITTADVSIDLATVFENVEMINATVADYILLKGDPEDAYEVAASGAIATDGVVTFDEVTLTTGNYFLAYEIDEAAAITEQGGALDMSEGGHEVYIPKEGVNAALADEFTIEMWARLNAIAGANTKLWGFSYYGGGEFGIEMEFLSNQTLQATRGKGAGWDQLNSDYVWQLGEWNHVAVTFDPDGMYRFYINGEMVDESEVTSVFQENIYDLALGKNIFNNAATNSTIDEFRIWTKAKTQEEIKADMYQTITDADTDLAYNYTFNQDDSGYLVNSGTTTVEVAYSNAAIIPATAAVREMESPYNNVVSGSWSVMNDATNTGMFYGATIEDYNNNIVIGKEAGDEVLAILGSTTTDTLYLNSRFMIDPLFIPSGVVKVDLSELFADLNQVELIANEYFLLGGDPSTELEVVATGTKENNVVTFSSISFDETPLYLAWKNIDEYPIGTFPIASSGLWKYNDSGVDLGTEWNTNEYDDSEWAFGNAILGYGDGIESTTLDYGDDADNKYPTYYLRHTFTVENASEIGNLLFNTMKDDGVVVYVNGVEAFRSNMPEGEITYNTYASSQIGGDDEAEWIEVETLNLLQDGENVIAVELHQGAASSSDLRFDMEVGYELPALEVTNFPVIKDSEWYYSDVDADYTTEWSTSDFDVIPWSRGNAPFGYGDPVNTEVSYGDNSSDKYITTYYVKDINVTLSELTENVQFGLRRDDGAVVYVNGVEVFRSNMPTGTINAETTANDAIDGINENIYFITEVAKTAFVEGVNRIAVEIHQANATSSDTRFDLFVKNTEDLGIDCTEDAIGCFTSIAPTAQTSNLIISEDHVFQVIMKEGDAYQTGTGNMPGNNDFTAYVAIDGSSEEGYLSINQENTPGGVSMLDVHLNTENNLWVVDDSQAVDMYDADLVTTTRNCSGGITPWGTVVTAEETMNSGDTNGDGYQDVGWLVEIDPATASVLDYENDGHKDKLWAMGRMNHENVVITDDATTAYYGEDGGTHCVYKYVMDTPGDLTTGTVYVLSLDLALSGNDPSSATGTWIEVPNDTQADRNNLNTVASNVGGTSFNGVEDVEINPITGQIYFTAKGLNRVYRFTDNGDTFSEFETFVGGKDYDVNTANGAQTEPWGDGNDNLTFDDQGNLWVLQDGGKNYIWVVRPDHTQSNPNVELFASMPSGSEPTGLTFTPDYKYGFFSVQHPSGSNTSQQDVTGEDITFNASTTIVFALENNLGTLANETVESVKESMQLYPNPTSGVVNLSFNTQEGGQEVSVQVIDVLGRQLMNINGLETTGGNQEVTLDLNSVVKGNQVLLLQVKIGNASQTFKVLTK
ncbi:Por secretion system C-terminal sorting domain-containing protein [Pustulibacterium marinum]|uniref:Por secretion system C-terminal sorting domain-containing protein n=1 Tax=Pustulibacterium marinum TaxID=1224947 RepID=A0A1I7HLP0_9FLAO|nr:LamG-like jellyroll fold domain-containing protein [Pustulibacterium marinum]SFU61684.1 Por secretion system C-terminal sorting domain-containing protein [Pustulibacterium marinum]